MKVVVIGAGVVGVATAWYLVRHGHEVTVVDRRAGPALETSFANAGGICPGFAGPWAAPGMPFKALRWLFSPAAPLKIRPRLDPHQWSWLASFLRNCTAARFAENKARMQRIAHYSKDCLVALREETGITYDNAAGGVLQIFRTEDELDGATRAATVLRELGVPHRLVDPSEIATIEPALASSGVAVAGGLHLPSDETGDAYLFTCRLAEILAERGCVFRFGCDVRALRAAGDRITEVATSGGSLTADSYVVAAGPFAPQLVRPLGIRLPVYPVKGYSITCQIVAEERAPRCSVMDERSKIMISRLGGRLRAAGAAEIAGFDRSLPPPAVDSIRQTLKMLFPGAADYEDISPWCGFRPMTPDGPARIGRTGYANLFLNTGHGSNGWTQACGSARILADLVSGRQPDIPP